MQSSLGHLQLNIRPANLPFYREVLTFLGWRIVHEDEATLGLVDNHQASLWFTAATSESANDRDGRGLNHLAIHTETQADVDTVAAWLTERGVDHLFETPRHRPEFAGQEGQTYYQVMFATPDGILIEVVYIGAMT